MAKWVGTWDIDSDKSSKTYRVSIAKDGTFGCNCQAWKFKRLECKHIVKLKKYYTAEINEVIKLHDIPLKFNDMTRDWDLMAFPDVRPLCTNPTEKRKKCGAYDDGRCDDDDGPCKGAGAIDPDEEFIPAGRKSMAEELEDELKELGDFTDEEMGREAPTLMSLITKNAQWRV